MKLNSEKTRLLEAVLLKGCFGIIDSKKLKDVDKILLDTVEEYSIIVNHRYIRPRSRNVLRSYDWYHHILPTYDEFRFKCYLRMTRNEFGNILQLVSKIQLPEDVNFHTRLATQLAVTLYRFGMYGNAASYSKVAHIFGISEGGAVKKCTDLTIKRLLQIKNEAIKWPDQHERQLICQKMDGILPGCIGYLDGSHIPLFEAPKDNHESYYSRKQQYGIHLQLVCDNECKIRHLMTGYPASAHDARVFANSDLLAKEDDLFDHNQWLAGDSAYRQSLHVITPFRDNSTLGTAVQRRKFNIHFSKYRVKIEQTFGALKQKFQSLRSLRVRVNKKQGHKRACEWIVACAILYNLIDVEIEDVSIPAEGNDRNDAFNFQDDNPNDLRVSLFNWFLRSLL